NATYYTGTTPTTGNCPVGSLAPRCAPIRMTSGAGQCCRESTKAPWLGPVDHFGGYFNYGQGASAYAGGSNLNSPGLFGSGNQVGLGVITDAVFLNGGQFELTTAWTAGWAMSISGWPTSRRLGTGPTRRSGTTTLSSTAACSAMALLA